MDVDTTKATMVAVKETDEILSELTTDSKVSVWGALFYIVAVTYQDLKTYFDTHTAYVDAALYNEKHGTLPWYKTKALAYQRGYDLVTDADYYDNSELTDTEIEESQIVKYAAVNESDDGKTLIIKIATESNDVLEPVSDEEEEAIKFYFEEIRIAGTPINVINSLADQLYLNIQIHINPLLFATDGMQKASGEYPIETTINTFLKTVGFNGELVLQDLEIAIRAIEGIEIAEIIEAKSAWIDAETDAYGTASVIDTKRIPESGYFQIVDFDSLTYNVV